MNNIYSIIDVAYDRYRLIQHPTEYLNFCKFYQKLNCKNVLEIGSYFGGNFYVMCKLSNIYGLKISIDCPTYQDKETQRNLSVAYSYMKRFSENAYVINTDSHAIETKVAVSNILKDQKLDFIFIDGDHSYYGVKKDFEMYSPFLKKGGYVAFHDINPTKDKYEFKYEVSKFWNELNCGDKIEFNSKSFFMGIGVIKIN